MRHIPTVMAAIAILTLFTLFQIFSKKDSPPQKFDNTPVAIYSNSIERIQTRTYENDDLLIVKPWTTIPIGAVGDDAMLGAHFWYVNDVKQDEFIVMFASWYHDWDNVTPSIVIADEELTYDENDTEYSPWDSETTVTERNESDWKNRSATITAGRTEIKMLPEDFARFARAKNPVACHIGSKTVELTYEARKPLRDLLKAFNKD